jgi:hypothetical protein
MSLVLEFWDDKLTTRHVENAPNGKAFPLLRAFLSRPDAPGISNLCGPLAVQLMLVSRNHTAITLDRGVRPQAAAEKYFGEWPKQRRNHHARLVSRTLDAGWGSQESTGGLGEAKRRGTDLRFRRFHECAASISGPFL